MCTRHYIIMLLTVSCTKRKHHAKHYRVRHVYEMLAIRQMLAAVYEKIR